MARRCLHLYELGQQPRHRIRIVKNLFSTLRGLRKQIAALPPQLRQLQWALHSFEYTNRGHSHELDELAARASDRRDASWLSDPQRCTRMRTLRDSTQRLINALGQLPRAQWPREFDALWGVPDEHGLLESLHLQGLSHDARLDLSLPLPLQASASLTKLDGELSLDIGLTHTRHHLWARRKLTFACPTLATLEGGWTARRDLQREFKKLCADIDGWPEFTAEQQRRSLESRLRESFEKLLSNLPQHERAWLDENWARMRPACIRKAVAGL